MEGTQTSVEEKLEIPRLDSSRGRVIAVVVAVLVVGAAIAVYFLTRVPAQSPYRAARVTQATIVKEIRVTGHLRLTDQVEVPAPIEGQLVQGNDTAVDGNLEDADQRRVAEPVLEPEFDTSRDVLQAAEGVELP